jgi:hypothetical protein
MRSEQTLELRIPSVLGFEKLAMDFAADVAKMMNVPEERVEDLKTAVAEACVNAIEHGNKPTPDEGRHRPTVIKPGAVRPARASARWRPRHQRARWPGKLAARPASPHQADG